ncbi:MAG: SLC13 family permease, partial [Verrucomicrobiales bacterium]
MSVESLQLIAVFGILGACFILFVKEWWPPDVVALAAFALCIALGLLDSEDIGSVFQNGAPLTIGAMFVLSAALVRTGLIESLGQKFQRAARGSEGRALWLLVLIVMPLSACVNNTPVVVVFLPIVIAFARDASLPASKFLMPLSFLSILGGTMTLFGSSTNILVAGVAKESGLKPFSVLEIMPLGLVYAAIGVLYLSTIGRRLLPERTSVSGAISSRETRDFISSALVPEGSRLIGKKLSEAPIWQDKKHRIFYLVRGGQRVGAVPLDQLVVEEGDVIVLKSSSKGIRELAGSGDLRFEAELDEDSRGNARLVEAMIGPQSDFTGKTLRQLRLREQHGVVVVALHRKGANLWQNLNQLVLQMGDTLLIEAPEENLERFEAREESLIFLNDTVERPYRRNKAPIAMIAMLAVVLAAAFGVPILTAALVGAVAVIVTGCLDAREAYRSVEWPILFIIFGMLGLGRAMENTGAAALVAETLTGLCAPLGPLAVLAMVYLLASVLTEIVTNNAVAVLLTPIVIAIAQSLEVDARPFVVAVMFGASASFITPIGY